jgi:hypothetical protein
VTIRVVRDQQATMRHQIHIGRNSLTTDLGVEDRVAQKCPIYKLMTEGTTETSTTLSRR